MNKLKEAGKFVNDNRMVRISLNMGECEKYTTTGNHRRAEFRQEKF